MRIKAEERLVIVESLAYHIERLMKREDFKGATIAFTLASQMIRETKAGARSSWSSITDPNGKYGNKDRAGAYYRKCVLGWLDRKVNPQDACDRCHKFKKLQVTDAGNLCKRCVTIVSRQGRAQI